MLKVTEGQEFLVNDKYVYKVVRGILLCTGVIRSSEEIKGILARHFDPKRGENEEDITHKVLRLEDDLTDLELEVSELREELSRQNKKIKKLTKFLVDELTGGECFENGK